MDFNVDKDATVERTNRHFSYTSTMENKWLDTTDIEKDLEVTINYDLKPRKQCYTCMS